MVDSSGFSWNQIVKELSAWQDLQKAFSAREAII